MRHVYLLVYYRVRRFWGLTDQIIRIRAPDDVTAKSDIGRVARFTQERRSI